MFVSLTSGDVTPEVEAQMDAAGGVPILRGAATGLRRDPAPRVVGARGTPRGARRGPARAAWPASRARYPPARLRHARRGDGRGSGLANRRAPAVRSSSRSANRWSCCAPPGCPSSPRSRSRARRARRCCRARPPPRNGRLARRDEARCARASPTRPTSARWSSALPDRGHSAGAAPRPRRRPRARPRRRPRPADGAPRRGADRRGAPGSAVRSARARRASAGSSPRSSTTSSLRLVPDARRRTRWRCSRELRGARLLDGARGRRGRQPAGRRRASWSRLGRARCSRTRRGSRSTSTRSSPERTGVLAVDALIVADPVDPAWDFEDPGGAATTNPAERCQAGRSTDRSSTAPGDRHDRHRRPEPTKPTSSTLYFGPGIAARRSSRRRSRPAARPTTSTTTCTCRATTPTRSRSTGRC